MILPDVNLLLYATIDAFPHHSRARQWWEEVINSNQPVGLVDPAVFGFLRISTNPRALAPPLSIEDASAHVRSWLSQPNVDRLVGGPNHIHIALDLLQAIGTAGNLTTGAQIAALAIEHGATVHTNDTDFARFQDVKWVNPLT